MPTQKRPRRAAAAKGKDPEGEARQAAVKIRRLRNLQRTILGLARQLTAAARRADRARTDLALELLAVDGQISVNREEWDTVRGERDRLASAVDALHHELAEVVQQRAELQAHVRNLQRAAPMDEPAVLAGHEH